jgi:hypothetical protein
MFCRACLVGTLLLGLPQLSQAASTTISWDHSPDSHVAGYLVSYGTQSGKYSAFLRVGYVNTITLSDLVVGQTYYLIVQSYYGRMEVLGRPTPEFVWTAEGFTVICPSPVLTAPVGTTLPVTLTPTVRGGTPPVRTSCDPPSGSPFPFGTSPFLCMALDARRAVDFCTGQVVILAPP